MVVCRDGGCLHACLHVFELTKVVWTEIVLSSALTLHCLEPVSLLLVNIDQQLL